MIRGARVQDHVACASKVVPDFFSPFFVNNYIMSSIVDKISQEQTSKGHSKSSSFKISKRAQLFFRSPRQNGFDNTATCSMAPGASSSYHFQFPATLNGVARPKNWEKRGLVAEEYETPGTYDDPSAEAVARTEFYALNRAYDILLLKYQDYMRYCCC